tara:strand:- start:1341 stop:1655 length:315 start_codon:yes stop_codon:yes gene_type:complete
MSKSSVKKTLAQAKEMGLELSPDGKSWVPIEELVVKLNPDKHKQVRISANNKEVNSSWLQWIFPVGSVALILVIIGALIVAWFIAKAFLGFISIISSLGGSAFG